MHKSTTIDVTSETPKGLGEKTYETHPRIGEWIEMEVDGVGTMFKVVMIAHSDSGDGSDIYIKTIGDSSSVIKNLCGQ